MSGHAQAHTPGPVVGTDARPPITKHGHIAVMIEPITLGGGKVVFASDGEARMFELISAQTAATGVQVYRYRPRL